MVIPAILRNEVMQKAILSHLGIEGCQESISNYGHLWRSMMYADPGKTIN